MTVKRAHGPCHGVSGGCSYDSMGMMAHTASCPSLYPAQQEPDALMRLARLIRMGPESGSLAHRDVFAVKALALISEAREEQRRAVITAGNGALDKVLGLLAQRSAMYSDAAEKLPMRAHLNDAKGAEDDMVAAAVRRMKDSEP